MICNDCSESMAIVALKVANMDKGKAQEIKASKVAIYRFCKKYNRIEVYDHECTEV